MRFNQSMYKELREALWQARKECHGSYLDIGPEESEFIIVPTHSWSHDEWSVAEFAWALAIRLELRAFIPLRNSFRRDSTIGAKIAGKNIIELGGIKRKDIELDSNELNLLCLTNIYFKKRKLNCKLVRFNSNFYDIHSETIKHYLRIEIPQRWRRTFENSFTFYKELEGLVDVLSNFELPEIDECRICGSRLEDSYDYKQFNPVERALRICTEHNITLSLPVLDVLKKQKLFVNYPVKKLKYSLDGICLACKSRFTGLGCICAKCLTTMSGSLDNLVKVACLGGLEKMVNAEIKRDPRNERNQRGDLSTVERTCVDCKSDYMLRLSSTRRNFYFCPSCRAKYDWGAVDNSIIREQFTMKDFASLPELRKEYLRIDV